jgi:hypothetical protein
MISRRFVNSSVIEIPDEIFQEDDYNTPIIPKITIIWYSKSMHYILLKTSNQQ